MISLNPFKLVLIFTWLFCLIRLSGQAQPLQTVIQKGHASVIKSVTTDKQGKFLFTGSRDKTAKLWDYQSGREIRTFMGHEHTVNHVAYHSETGKLLTSSADNTIKIWDVNTGDASFSVSADKFMTCGDWSPDGKTIALGGYSNVIEVWNIDTQTKLKTIKANSERGLGYGLAVNYSPDGKMLAIGQDNQLLSVYDTESWKKKFDLKIKAGYCGGCISMSDFGPNGRLIAKLANKGPLSIYNLSDSSEILSIGKRWEDIIAVQFNAMGDQLLAATQKSIYVLSPISGDTLVNLNAVKPEKFNDAVFSSDGKEIVIGLENGTIKRLDLVNQETSMIYEGILNHKNEGDLGYDKHNYWHGKLAQYIKFKNETQYSPLTKTLIYGKNGSAAKGWYTKSGETVQEYLGKEKSIIGLDISQDGTTLLGGDAGGQIHLWDVKKGKSMKTIKGPPYLMFETKFTPDGTGFTAVSWDATIGRWDIKTGKRTGYIPLDNSSAYTHVLSPNGLYAALGRIGNNNLELWEFDTRSMVKTFIGHQDLISSISFSRSGEEILSSSWDGSTIIWSLSTALMQRKLKSNTPIYCSIYSQNEQQVITGGADRKVIFWDKVTGSKLRILEGHSAAISSIIITPDNTTLISTDVDGTTIFWDLDTGNQKFQYVGIGRKDWMILTNEGYFSATNGAREAIHFVRGTKVYALDQFFDTYYKPKKVQKLLSQVSGTRNENIASTLAKFPPPDVKLAVTQDRNDESMATLYIRLVDKKGGAENIKIFHNGKRLAVNPDKLTTLKSRGDTTTLTYPMTLLSGTNTFEASASSKGSIESSRAKTTLKTVLIPEKATCHIITIGINDYANDKLDLNYAKADASAFAAALQKDASLIFSEIKVHALYDKDATKASILQKLEDLAEIIRLQDVLIFYYAGHGSMVDDHFYFISSDNTRLYDPKSLEKNAINANVVQQKLAQIKALKQIIIMDACQSGSSVEVLAQRGAQEEKAVAQLARSTGIHVLASAGSDQSATEFETLGHGLFTHVLLEALQGKADGAPKDGKVTVYELKSYIDNLVPERSEKLKGSPQYPFTFSRGHDFPLIFKE